MVIHAYNLSTKEAEAGGLWVWGHPGLYNVVRPYLKKKQKVKDGKFYIIYILL
jgi:hypothetical protein